MLSKKLEAVFAVANYTVHNEAEYDSDCSSEASFDSEVDDAEEMIEDLRTDVQCLMDLSPLLKDPILDPASQKEPTISARWEPYEPYIYKIIQRFPSAEAPLVRKLGEANWARYLRCQEDRNRTENEELLLKEEQGPSDIIAASRFQDSGLGASVQAMSSYAESIMTYNGNDGQKVRIPPLPEEGKEGQPFPCVACGRMAQIKDNSSWR